MATEYKFIIHSEYNQFYVFDRDFGGMLEEVWSDKDFSARVSFDEFTFSVLTASESDVPVFVRLLESEPELILTQWDHVVEICCSFPSGKIVFQNCMASFEKEFDIKPGKYRVRVSQSKLDRVSEGDDAYQIDLWRSDCADFKVLKQYSGGAGF